MSLGKQLLGDSRRKALKRIESKIKFNQQLKEIAYLLGFFFTVLGTIITMSYLPPLVNYGIAVVVTLALVAGFGWVGRNCVGRLRRSGNPTELLPVLMAVLVLTAYFFVLGLILSSVTGWMGYEEWLHRVGPPMMWILSFLQLGLVVLAFFGLFTRRHYLNTILPIPLRGALVRVDDLLDGYSERPVDTGVVLEGFFSDKGKAFLKKLMFLGIIPDYQYQEGKEGSEARLFIGSPNPPMKLSFFSFQPKDSGSHIRVAAGGSVEVYLSQKHYQLLEDPYSYHQLCSELAGMLEQAYQLFAKGEEKTAFDVFVVKGKGVFG